MQGLRRVQIISILHAEPFIRAVVREVEEQAAQGLEIEAMVSNLKSLFKKSVELSPNLTDDQLSIILSIDEPEPVADMVASMIPIPLEEKEKILETFELEVTGAERQRALLTLG